MRRGLVLVAGMTLLFAAISMDGAGAAALRCPGRMPGPHDGFAQLGPQPASTLPLRAMRLFDGPPGEETKEAPVELAPDGTTRQRGVEVTDWRFAGDEHLLLLCDYRGTTSYYRMALPAVPHSCRMTDGPDGVVAGCD